MYEYDGARVLKVSHEGFEGSVRREAENTAAVTAAGAPAPKFHGFEEVEGRPGAIYDRAEGVSMLEVLRSSEPRTLAMAERLASVHSSILSCATDALPRLHDRLLHALNSPAVPSDISATARHVLGDLPSEDSVLHGDMHPGNVIVTEDQATVIDWVDASVGPPAADVARSLWLMNPATVPVGSSVEERSLRVLAVEFRRRYRDEVQRLAGISHGIVARWSIPVMAARLAEEIESERVHLVTEIRRVMTRR